MSTFLLPCVGKPPRTWQTPLGLSAAALQHCIQQQEGVRAEQPVSCSPGSLAPSCFQFMVPFISHCTLAVIPRVPLPSVPSVFAGGVVPHQEQGLAPPFHLCRAVSAAEMGVPQTTALQSCTGSPISPCDLAQRLLPDISCTSLTSHHTVCTRGQISEQLGDGLALF